MKEKGITLISLVVTIVVLLILAGITIGTVFSDNGIIKKAQEAANLTEQAVLNEQEELNSLLDQLNSITNGTGGTGGGGDTPVTAEITGRIVWSTGSASLELTISEPDITIQYRKNNDMNWIDYSSPIPSLLNGDKVYAKGVRGGVTVVQEKQFDILDKTPPTVTIANISSTTNSISATATATDNEAGMGASSQYTFYIKKTSEGDSSYIEIGSGSSTSVTKGDLDQDTSYTVKVEVSDVAGNKGQATREITTGKIGDATDGLTNGTIIASSPQWSNGTASITLSTSSGLTIQYQKNGAGGSWTTGTNVTELHHNDTVFARLTDGRNYGGEASITILDTVNPQDASINLSGTSTNTEGSITATVTLVDNESGVNITGSKWVYNTTASAITVTQLVTGISISPPSVTLAVGQTQQLTTIITPSNANDKGIIWNSEDNTIVSVNSSGLVTARSVGSTTVTATTTDGSNKSSICSITVTKELATNVDELEEGNYVTYIDGTNTPRTCAVLYDSSSDYGVQIITMDTVEDYIQIGSNTLSVARSGYNNAISTFNTTAREYNNSTYSSDARCVGSVPNNPDFESGSSIYSGKTGKNEMKDEDSNYQTDYDKLVELNINNIGKEYWLASRYVRKQSVTDTDFFVRKISSDGVLSATNPVLLSLYGDSGYGAESNMRPVFILKNGIKVTGGNGTLSNPYTLGT